MTNCEGKIATVKFAQAQTGSSLGMPWRYPQRRKYDLRPKWFGIDELRPLGRNRRVAKRSWYRTKTERTAQ